jgi:rRNA-processing protein FCF1
MKPHPVNDGLAPHYPYEPIYSVAALSRALGVREIRLKHVAQMADGLYRVAAEEIKPDGSKRQTYDAKPLLKAIQIRIKERILKQVQCPLYLNGSLIGRGTRTNAEPHVDAKILFEEDISNFFPSINPEIVKHMWSGLFGFSEDVSELLTLLTTKDQGVPQGAVTSSYLANLVFWSHEPNMVRRFTKRGLVYSRFVDDISVTSKKRIDPKDKSYVIGEIYGMLRRYKVKPKASKHKISTAKERMATTKLVINTRVSMPKERRRNLRAAVYKLEQRVVFDQHDEELLKEINSVAVKVGQLRQFHKVEAEKLQERLRNIRGRLVYDHEVIGL